MAHGVYTMAVIYIHNLYLYPVLLNRNVTQLNIVLGQPQPKSGYEHKMQLMW